MCQTMTCYRYCSCGVTALRQFAWAWSGTNNYITIKNTHLTWDQRMCTQTIPRWRISLQGCSSTKPWGHAAGQWTAPFHVGLPLQSPQPVSKARSSQEPPTNTSSESVHLRSKSDGKGRPRRNIGPTCGHSSVGAPLKGYYSLTSPLICYNWST